MNGLITYAQKEKGIASQPTSEERLTYFTFSKIQISPKEEMEVNSLFLIIKEQSIASPREKNEYNICYTSGQNLPWFRFIFLLPGNSKDYENECL